MLYIDPKFDPTRLMNPLTTLPLFDSDNPLTLYCSGAAKSSDIRGAAEPIRWAMEQGGLEWIDNRLSKQEFGTLKPSA